MEVIGKILERVERVLDLSHQWSCYLHCFNPCYLQVFCKRLLFVHIPFDVQRHCYVNYLQISQGMEKVHVDVVEN